MAQKVQITLTCDLDGSDDDVQTVTFGFDGYNYAMELCAADREEFTNTMDSWSAAARRETGRGRRAAAAPTAARPRAPKEDLNELRAWAKANGYRVADRGRVSAEVREAYAAAQG